MRQTIRSVRDGQQLQPHFGFHGAAEPLNCRYMRVTRVTAAVTLSTLTWHAAQLIVIHTVAGIFTGTLRYSRLAVPTSRHVDCPSCRYCTVTCDCDCDSREASHIPRR
ncbi:hypothetical protein J6590_002501 [Homalodisca vitripennis]|nr:hypothetical protein J6590_002501 [Homalodisca vitripennis]